MLAAIHNAEENVTCAEIVCVVKDKASLSSLVQNDMLIQLSVKWNAYPAVCKMACNCGLGKESLLNAPISV